MIRTLSKFFGTLFKALFGSKKRVAASGSAISGSVAALAFTINLVGGFEGIELEAYYDIVGVPTICQGLTEDVKIGDTATKEECDRRFAAELKKFEDGLKRCIDPWNNLPVYTRTALVSWAYNVGVHGACTSTAVKRFNAGLYEKGCKQITRWNKGRINGQLQVIRGLTIRREKEYALCVKNL